MTLRVPRPTRLAATLLPALWACASLARAATSAACVGIDDDAARLACYDRAAGRAPAAAAATSIPPTTSTAPAAAAAPAARTAGAVAGGSLHARGDGIGSALSAVWELDAADRRGVLRLVPHKLNYLLPLVHTNRPNTMPSTPAAGRDVPRGLPLDAVEAKFQLSFKLKAWENVFGDNGDVWFGYTQQSNWQLFSGDTSSPFRESNHEPEAILSLRTDAEWLGWRWRLLNLGYVHQSNGRPLPLSRSWNRVYAQFGFERGAFTVLARPWLRVPERDEDDDNPDIRQHLGSGDLRVVYAHGGHVLSALGRYSFSGRRGGLELDWAYPISGGLKGYLQLTHGRGASLIDYNHAQTTVGVGVLLLPWF